MALNPSIDSSLGGVVLQYRTLDLITDGHEGTCLVLGEETCFYVDESNMVETKVNNPQNNFLKDLLSKF